MSKPLGRKSYGSIGHLPNSRLGPGDHSVPEGSARICTVSARDRHDRIIVQEKLDGANTGIARLDGQIIALGRAGYLAETSPFAQHHHFASWVRGQARRFLDILEDDERICGEWLMQAHGTRYALSHEPFVAFDLMRGAQRYPFDEFSDRAARAGLIVPFLISDQTGRDSSVSVEDAMTTLGEFGRHGALDPVEGAVWRVERQGKVDFLAKFVRHEKEDGLYLPEISGGETIWNWPPPDP